MIRIGRWVWAFLCASCAMLNVAGEEPLRTGAERSDYRRTSTYGEVLAFCQALTNRVAYARLTSFGISGQGRELPLLVLSDPAVADPAEAADKPVILLLGNIHGGEVCGKEALLMLARELGLNQDSILKEFVLLFAPIYNPDGNEPFSIENRSRQNGPAEGVGQRGNGAGLDLNRDFMKVEAPETRALIRLLRDWDPILTIDTHTTNGSKHRYALTYCGPRHPAGAQSIVEYTREKFLPEVSRRVLASSGLETYFYGNIEEDATRWVTYPDLPRFGVHYIGVRNRLAILSEAYAYASFRERVEATVAFVRESLRVTVTEKSSILALLHEAGRWAAHPAPGERVALRSRLAPFAERVAIRGERETVEEHQLEYWGRSETTRDVALPYAYVVPRGQVTVLTNLLRHGIKVDELRETLELEVEVYGVESVDHQTEPFEGHRLATWSVRAQTQQNRVEAGTWVVRTAQPLGRLAALLLEPESEDGLAAWNAFDEVATPGECFPVTRLLRDTSLLSAPVAPLPEERPPKRRVTFDVVYGKDKADFDGSATRVTGWVGPRFLQAREGVLRSVDPLTGESTPLFDAAKVKAALQMLPEFDERAAEAISRRTSFQFDPATQGALIEHANDLYYFRLDGSSAARLTRSPEREELMEFSPDGKWVSFVREADLYVVDLSNRVERALTTDGGRDVLNGKAGWVYFEEIYHRKWKAYWWSPDSRQIAFIRFDESQLPMFHALNTLPLHGRLESMRHPKAGDRNPDVRLGVVSAAGGAPQWADLSNYSDFLLTRVGWMQAQDAVYAYVQDRAQTWLDVLVWELPRGNTERLFREQSQAWVDDPGDLLFWNGDLILKSDRTGWRHLYRFSAGDWSALTDGDWEVRTVHGLDPEAGWIYFSGTRDSHLGENLYRCRPDGRTMERLTSESGHHDVALSPDFEYVVDRWSDYERPTRVQLLRANGAPARVLDSNPIRALDQFEFGRSELVRIPSRDGFVFEGSITWPPDFTSGQRYPVWFLTYGGPQAPSVRDAWRSGRAFDQLLAAMGVVVFRMDPRSASGKGSRAAWSIYRQMGVGELADIEEGIAWLKSKPYIDGDRIGMSGHSYGGFMTAYALTHSRSFAAGIAGAPVTDWRYYDSIYTERYMDTPQNNPEGYDKTSVVKAAKDLHGRLLILHGIMDDNVHLQNAVALVQALQKADKQFELMVYPEMKHGLSGQHYNRLIVDFIRRTVLDRSSREDAPSTPGFEQAASP